MEVGLFHLRNSAVQGLKCQALDMFLISNPVI